MNSNEINQNRGQLIQLIEKSIISSFSSSTKLKEPDYVALLSSKFAKDLFDILVSVFPAYEFSVSGVFCHQKPIVDIGLSKKSELGDVLFVYCDKTQNLFNSLLFQAKMASSNSLKISSQDKHQLTLYKEWPKFKYFRAGSLNGEERNILPKTINDGAQYLLINPWSPYEYRGMRCAVPSEYLIGNRSLSVELLDFFKHKSGRAFEGLGNPITSDDWTRMINDLLSIAKGIMSRQKSIGSFPRSNNYINLYTDGMKGKSFFTVGDGSLTEPMNDTCNDRGLSVVLIESVRKEDYKK